MGVLLGLLALVRPWLRGEEVYDEANLQEWLEEARAPHKTLPQLIDGYLKAKKRLVELEQRMDNNQATPRELDPGGAEPPRFPQKRLPGGPKTGEPRGGKAGPPPRKGVPRPHDPLEAPEHELRKVMAAKTESIKREEIYEHLRALGTPTEMYGSQMVLFPVIFRLQVSFTPNQESDGTGSQSEGKSGIPDIVWDAGLPLDNSQYQEMEHLIHPQATVRVRYRLHAHSKREAIEHEYRQRLLQVIGVVAVGALLGLAWGAYSLWREQERERQRMLAQYQVDQAERLLLLEESRHQETERKLLEQQLARQAAEGQALELKSQLYASIGIMAGSYAHNIKNLLVRPNDLLRRCLDSAGIQTDHRLMLQEVQETLGTVTQRLQQILQTVRRDPSQSEEQVLDLNGVIRDIGRTWQQLAREKWKIELTIQLNTHQIVGSGGAKPPSRRGNAPTAPQKDTRCARNKPGNLDERRVHLTGDEVFPPFAPLGPVPEEAAELDRRVERDREEALWIAGDASHLQQAVENLLFNARDATFEMRNHLRNEARSRQDLDSVGRREALIAAAAWKGSVIIRTFEEEEGAILEVTDNGQGMTDDIRQRCVETHFSTKRDNALYEGHSTGMGLGLSFVVTILEHHRASLQIDSTPRQGTTFRIRFPAVKDSGDPPRPAPEPGGSGGAKSRR